MQIRASLSSGRWIPLPALGAGATIAWALLDPSRTTELGLFDGAALTALLGTLAGSRRPGGAGRATTLWIAAALVAFLAGELLWLKSPSAGIGPFPSAYAAVFLLACLLLAPAALALSRRGEGRSDRPAWLEAGIVAAAVTAISWRALIEPGLHSARLDAAARLVTVGQPVVDAILLGLAARLVLPRAARNRAALALAAGLSLLGGTDLVYRFRGLGPSFRPGSATDWLWPLAFVLIGLAGAVPLGLRASRGGKDAERLRLAAVLLAVFVPDAMVLRDLDHRHLLALNTLTALTSLSMLAIALAAVRMLHLIGRARQAEVHRGEARLSALILHSADAIFLVDTAGRISFASPSAEELSGRGAEALLGSSLLEWFVEDQREARPHQLDALAALPLNATITLEGPVSGADGQIRILEGVGRNLLADANVGAIVVTLRDTTSRRELEQQLERRAFHDELTGLANRALFADRLTHAIQRKSREARGRARRAVRRPRRLQGRERRHGPRRRGRAAPQRRRADPLERPPGRHGRAARRRRVRGADRGHAVEVARDDARRAAARDPPASDRRDGRRARRAGERRRRRSRPTRAPSSRSSGTRTSRCTAPSRRARGGSRSSTRRSARSRSSGSPSRSSCRRR